MSSPIPASLSHLSKPLSVPISQEDLVLINSHLKELQPDEILRWAVEYAPGLHQTTAFGLTGLVAIDMLSKITQNPPPLIFIDTLYHFKETYELVDEVKRKYGVPVHVYKPEGCSTVQDFEVKYGEKLWEKDEAAYDFIVKVRHLLILFIIDAQMIRRWNQHGELMKNWVSNLLSLAVEHPKVPTVHP